MNFYSGFICTLLIQLINLLKISGYSVDSLITNGCTAYDCKRNCFGSDISQTPGDNGFRIIVEGAKDRYVPNKDYKISIVAAPETRNSALQFRGFLVVAVPETWYDAMPFYPLGKFKIHANDRVAKYSSGCSEMVTHLDFEPKKNISVFWTAPPAGSGCISIKALVIQTETLWLKDDGSLTYTLCEDDAAVKEVIPECCACGEAKYSMIFKGIWSKETHPKDWPENEWLTHWSNVIGAVHSKNYTVWEYGGMASPGLVELAEYGIVRTLEEELKKDSFKYVIRNIVVASGLWHPYVTNETSAWLSTSKSHHLFSMATMLGPSPDWLTGASKINLCLPNCTWATTYTEDLYPFDAGSDSGVSYNSPNRPTSPQEPIHKITSSYPNNPKSPFYDPTGKPMKPVARLILKQELLRGAQCPNGIKTNENNDAKLIDFGLTDYTDLLTRSKATAGGSFKKENVKDKKPKIIGELNDPRCMTLDWTQWSECSRTCGTGIRKRSRQYKDIKQAMGVCNERLEDSELCLLISCQRRADDHAYDIENICFMVTQWSEWSHCSVSCGIGETTRFRDYHRPEFSRNCNTSLVENRRCDNGKCKEISIDERKQICSMEKDYGPCKTIGKNTRYYYDSKAKQCLQFEYGGCRGNKNNFQNVDDCEKMCHGIENMVDKKMCMLPKEEGTCFDSIPRYYFDRTKLICAPLEYSGCGGNDNNFGSKIECEANCNPVIDLIKDAEENMKNVDDLTIPEKKKICMSPEQVGNCGDKIPRFYYSVQMGKCLTFDYSGCDGNLNNFETVERCQKTCDVLINMTIDANNNEQKQNEELKKKEMCMQTKEVGPCTNYVPRYYFDTKMGKCKTFMFGGCNQNENNFESLTECESTCSALIQMSMEAKTSNIDMDGIHLTMEEKEEICKAPLNEGTCSEHLKRYFFNTYSNDCEDFTYTGCNGNANNFLTYDECKKRCGNMMNDAGFNSKIKSDKMDQFIPIDCLLSEWSAWSECPVNECGRKGKSTRHREIKVHAAYGGQECSNKTFEMRVCFKKCNYPEVDRKPIDCIVGVWGMWSECKTYNSCEGYQERERPILKQPQYGGIECPKLKEKRKCFIGRCNNKARKNL